MMVVIIPRADSASVSSALISSATSAVPSSTPGASSTSPSQGFSKNVLEWLFLALALLSIGVVIHRRLNTVRRNGQGPTSFFSTRSYVQPRPSGRFQSTYSSSLSAYDLANVPTAYNPFSHSMFSDRNRNRYAQAPVRAADIGAGGRRVAGGPSDYNGELGDQDKDALPAYDKFGGPPGYIDALPALTAVRSTTAAEGDGSVHPQGLAPEYSAEEERREIS